MDDLREAAATREAEPEAVDALVVGGGPAGLMAAEALLAAGRRVVVAERMPTPGRKLLMAGRSGLNLTRAEGAAAMAPAFGGAWGRLSPMVAAMDSEAVQDWARGLGQPLYTGSTGRVFPRAMKASPLLRAWRARLEAGGVAIRARWRWAGITPDGAALVFDAPEGPRAIRPAVAVLALGGASWRRLGSDGAWAEALAALGVPLAPFAPANAGLSVAWSGPMAQHFGAPVKGVALRAGACASRGEVVVSARGLEGGGLYPLTPALREGVALTMDLAPDRDLAAVEQALARVPARVSLANRLRRALRLAPVKVALLHEWGERVAPLARRIKALPVRHEGLRPMDEAISTAGGVAWKGLDEGLMLRAAPGVFACGEMLDWEAPTGGYLLTASLATGAWAGRHAAGWRDGCGVSGPR